MVVKKKTVSKTTTKAKTTKSTVKKKTTTKATKTKVAAKSTTELTVSGNKKIGTLQKEFNKKFPYLQLCIFYSYARDQVKKGETITQISGDKTLVQVRRADSGGTISISGNKRIGTLEKEFDTVFGLYCQVCYYDSTGHSYYTGSTSDTYTLSAFNKKVEAEGGKKGKIR